MYIVIHTHTHIYILTKYNIHQTTVVLKMEDPPFDLFGKLSLSQALPAQTAALAQFVAYSFAYLHREFSIELSKLR